MYLIIAYFCYNKILPYEVKIAKREKIQKL